MDVEKAVIEDVTLYSDTSYFIEEFEGCHPIEERWETRPKFYGDTDVIVVDMKTSEGKRIANAFPLVLKFDGTLERNALSKRSRLRRNRFAAFVEHYRITEKIEGYSIPRRMSEWKGKKVEVVNYMGMDQVFIPDHLIRDP